MAPVKVLEQAALEQKAVVPKRPSHHANRSVLRKLKRLQVDDSDDDSPEITIE